jgi:acetyl esterase/lipase
VPSLPFPLASRTVRLLALALRPGVPWPTSRRAIELGLMFPPPPRGTRFTPVSVGGVPCEEVRGPGGSVSEDDTRALLYFHGGGYVVCSPRTHRPVTARMAAAFGARVIAPDYRMAPEHPFPAALDDARAVWSALSAQLEPSRIAVAGDSAGAGMALDLVMSLPAAARPGAIGLICPWLDPAPDLTRTRPHVPGDALLSPGLLHRFATAYYADGTAPASALDGDASLAGLPPLVVHVAGEDTLRSDGDRLIAAARAAGVDLTAETLERYWHDPHLSAALLPEPVRGACARMAAQLRAHIA